MSSGKHILVVEDEIHLATGIKYNLEAEGYRVTTMGDGPSALRFIQESRNNVDLVVLDLMLPGMTGYAVCEALRSSDEIMPILILSARTLAEDRTRGFDVGADQYMMKPFDLDEFLSRIKGLLVMHGRRVDARRSGPSQSPPIPSAMSRSVSISGSDGGRRRGADDAIGNEALNYFVENEGRIISRQGTPGKRLGSARQLEHAGPRPVHPPAPQGVGAGPVQPPAFPHPPRRRLPFRGRPGEGRRRDGKRPRIG